MTTPKSLEDQLREALAFQSEHEYGLAKDHRHLQSIISGLIECAVAASAAQANLYTPSFCYDINDALTALRETLTKERE